MAFQKNNRLEHEQVPINLCYYAKLGYRDMKNTYDCIRTIEPHLMSIICNICNGGVLNSVMIRERIVVVWVRHSY